MADTRTEAERIIGVGIVEIPLEQLQQLGARIEQQSMLIDDIQAHNQRLRTENEALRADGERLDWLVVGDGGTKPVRIQGNDQRGWMAMDCSNGLVILFRGKRTFRDAIDAARGVTVDEVGGAK